MVGAPRDAVVRYVTVGDVSVAYQVRHGGPIDVVYVHGLLNLIEATDEEPALARHLDRMAAFARLVLFDKRGTGLSDRVSIDEMTDAERRLDDLSGVMDAAGLDAAVLFATDRRRLPHALRGARHRAGLRRR